MKLMLTMVTTIACFYFVVQCRKPKDEVEIIPEAAENERATMKLFWGLMYEVCKTFCVWRKVCTSFCELFNPNNNPDFGMKFDLITHSSLMSQDSMARLYTTITKICEDEVTCIESCMNMELEDGDGWSAADQNPDNLLHDLYQLSKSYFAQCAKINRKPLHVVDAFTVDQFCKEITAAGRELTQKCLQLLT